MELKINRLKQDGLSDFTDLICLKLHVLFLYFLNSKMKTVVGIVVTVAGNTYRAPIMHQAVLSTLRVLI